jgi:diguanylate cyclase (GGDEF)-like protein/PAS domain S-box-containing protein
MNRLDPRDRPELLALLATYLEERVLLITADGTMLAALGPSPGLLGYGPEQRGMHIAERVHPDDLPGVLQLLERARASAELEERIVVRARHKDGTWRRIEATVFSRVDDPALDAGVVRVRDVTEALDQQERTPEGSRFVSLAEALPIGVLSADAGDFVVMANDAALIALGSNFDGVRGQAWLERVVEADRARVEDAISNVRGTRRPVEVTAAVRRDDAVASLHLLLVPLSEEGRYVGWVATVEDVTRRLVAERELAHRATHDALTGLPNRWLLVDRLAQALAKLERREGGVAVLFIDVDGLKAHNDAYGHAVGDAVLREIAERLRRALRPSDTAARIGGDEFVVVCDVADAGEAEQLAERLRGALEHRYQHGDERLLVSASVGVTFTDDPEANPEQALAQADVAMYAAKARTKR